MTTQKPSFYHVLHALVVLVLLWTAALGYGQAQPSGITYGRGASPALSGTTAAPTQSPMVYHGGPVLSNSTTYAFWWGNPADFPADAVTGMEQFLSGLNGSSYLSIGDQYMLGLKASTVFGGSFYDNSTPPSKLTGQPPPPRFSLNGKARPYLDLALDVAVHLYNFLNDNGLKPDPTGIYFIFTSNFPSDDSLFCALHDDLVSGSNVLFQFAWVPNPTGNYGCRPEGDVNQADPYLASNNYSAGTHAMINISSHEFMETITDPHINAWYANDANGSEIGDACLNVFQNWVELTNSSRWKIQEEWSNQANGCVQGDGSPVQLLGAASNFSSTTTFNIPGATYGIFGTGINDGATIAGVYYDANFSLPLAAFERVPLGNLTIFNVPSAIETVAHGINSNGAIAGTDLDASGTHGFVRDPLGNITTFDVRASELSNNTDATGINAAGAITGIYEEGSIGAHGFVRDPLGNITTFDAPGMPYQTFPLAINDNGAIAGLYADLNQPPHGFVRDPLGNITTFDAPAGVNGTEALSINLQGAIAGTYTDASFVKRGFVRSPSGTFTTFDAPGAVYGTVAHSINNSGAVAGFYSDINGVSHGFVRDQHGNFTTLSDIPWSMNNNGATTGYKTVAIKK